MHKSSIVFIQICLANHQILKQGSEGLGQIFCGAILLQEESKTCIAAEREKKIHVDDNSECSS